MKVGYGLKTRSRNNKLSDEPILKALGCERIFIGKKIDEHSHEEQLQAALEYMRSGDILVVVNLDRLGITLEHILKLVSELHRSGIAVHAEQNGITPQETAGSQFGPICAMLTALSATLGSRRSNRFDRARSGGRGRPMVLSAKDRAEAERMLELGNSTPLDIARRLNVSLSTVYRRIRRDRSKAFKTSEPGSQ